MGFADQMGKHAPNYLEQMADYLAQRGLDCRDFGFVTYAQKPMGLYHKAGPMVHERRPFVPEGWAYRLRAASGDYYDDQLLMRVCNWPDGPLVDKEGVLLEKRPKFLHIGKETTHWASTLHECQNSPVVMLHEKYTSAQLAVKHLGIPSVALSGCWNWSKGKKLKPEIERLLAAMQGGAELLVCFDGDMDRNDLIMDSARALLAWVENRRPDLKVRFPKVPAVSEDVVGWDDWVVAKDRSGEDVADAWLVELNRQGFEVTSRMPSALLVELFGLATKTVREVEYIVHSLDNYARIFDQHPQWDDYVVNIDGMIYDKNDPSQPLESRALGLKFVRWLETNVFHSVKGGEGVSKSHALDAVEEVMARPHRRVSLPHLHIDRMNAQGVPTLSEARSAAQRLITEGVRVVGPLRGEEAIETILRAYRDMVGMWGLDASFCPQWMLALVGPSGAGKSDFARSALRCMSSRGFTTSVGKLSYTGDKSKPEEMARIMAVSLLAVLDEYNPSSQLGKAKEFEDQMLALSSTRSVLIRRMRKDNPVPHIRMSSIIITTTDKNRQFLRSGKGEGAERRTIVLEIVGHKDYYGKLSSDREVIAQCSETLIRWGLEAWRERWGGDATEYSSKYAAQYLEDDEALRNVGMIWAGSGNLGEKLAVFGQRMYRKQTGDVRFSPTQLYAMFMPGERVSREQATKFRVLAVECGAVSVGKARVNNPASGAPGPQVDMAYSIKDWEEWSSRVRAALGV